MNLTQEQRDVLIALANAGNGAEAIERCIALCNDDLAASLLERGGHGTLQLNPDPHAIPRIQFVAPDKTQTVQAAKIGNVVIVRG